MNEKFVVEWYNFSLTERERKELLVSIPRAFEYGSARSYMLLPEQAKQVLRDAFRDTLADHCEANGEPCCCAACRAMRIDARTGVTRQPPKEGTVIRIAGQDGKP